MIGWGGVQRRGGGPPLEEAAVVLLLAAGSPPAPRRHPRRCALLLLNTRPDARVGRRPTAAAALALAGGLPRRAAQQRIQSTHRRYAERSAPHGTVDAVAAAAAEAGL